MTLNKLTALAAACAMSLAVLVGCAGSDSSSQAEKVSGSDNRGSESLDSEAENTGFYSGEHKDMGWQWGNVEIVGGGFVPNVVYNPSEEGLVYARTDIGGAYKLNKDTNRWECITDFIGAEDWNLMGIESIATDPVEPNRLYLAAGTYTSSPGAMLISEDYGENFDKVDLPFGNGGNEVCRGTGERLQVDPNKNSIIYFGSRKNGLWRSEDYGKSWSKVDAFPTEGGYVEDGFSAGLTFIAFDKSSSSAGEATKTIFVGAARNSGNMLYRSDDAGATWQEVENPVSEMAGGSDKLRPVQGEVSSDGFLYTTWSYKIGPNNATMGAVQKYDIAAGTWKEITPTAKFSNGYSGISVNPNDPKNIVCTTLCLWAIVDNVFVSHDGGETWTGFWDPDTKEHNYTLDISSSRWLDWQGQAKLGWWMTGVAINPFNPDEIMYGTGATIFGTTNLTKIGSEPVNLEVRAMGIEETAIFDFVSPKQLDDDTPDLYSIMGDIYGFRHDDADAAPEEHFGDFACTDIDCAVSNYNIVARATTEKYESVVYSTDAGRTWKTIKNLPEGLKGRSGGQISLSCDGSTLLWQSSEVGAELYATDDWGETWVNCEGVSNAAQIESDKVNPKKFYATRDGTFYMSEDGGKNFKKVCDFLVSSVVMTAAPNEEGMVYVSVAGGGVYVLNIEGGTLDRTPGDIQSCKALGLGAPEKEGDPDTLFILGEANNEGYGVYISQDRGATWKRINDDTQKWGNVNAKISGDPKTFGRCYISTNGRGIIRGDKK